MILPYTIREGLAGFKRNRLALVASTGAITVALVLIGLFSLVGYEANQVVDWLKQRAGEMDIFLEDTTPQITEALYNRVQVTPGVAQATFISKEEAGKIFQKEFGEGAEIYLDEQFLPASIRVSVEPGYAQTDSLKRLAAEFGRWNHVDEVVYNQPLLVKVQENVHILSMTGFSLGLIVILASIFLIANTIRLTIYARRLMIRTMKLVGATDRFIRTPFIVEGVAQGAISGFLAGLLLLLLTSFATTYIIRIEGPGFWGGLLITFLLTLTGALLGFLGALVAARRFISRVALH